MGDLADCHQVLAYGYDLIGANLTLYLWDPNNPASDNITLNLNIANPSKDTPLTFFNGQTPDSSKYRGFFRTHYGYHDPLKPTSAAFIVQAVSSPGISSPGPIPRVATVRKWLQWYGDPVVRFTGSVHDWSPNTVLSYVGDLGKPLLQVMATITTGGDNLRAGNHANDNADITLNLSQNKLLTFQNINNGQHWNNGEVHRVILPLPVGTRSGDIEGITLHTQFGGGLGGDNWNVNGVLLEAFLPPTSPLNVELDRNWMSESGNPLVRFTGGTHDWSMSVSHPPAETAKLIKSLNVTITTGGDDLRGGHGANDNTDVILGFSNGTTKEIRNINGFQNWKNNETHTAYLPLPPGTRAGDITKFTLHTQFGGGIGGDNWNVNQILLQATMDNSAP